MASLPSPPLSGGSADSIGDPARFGVITVSDRASSGVYEDLSGPAILHFFNEAIQSPWTTDYRVIPDEQEQIENTIKDMVRLEEVNEGMARPGGEMVGRPHCGPLAARACTRRPTPLGMPRCAGGQQRVLPGGHHGWHGPGAPRCDARSHRGGVHQDAAGVSSHGENRLPRQGFLVAQARPGLRNPSPFNMAVDGWRIA